MSVSPRPRDNVELFVIFLVTSKFTTTLLLYTNACSQNIKRICASMLALKHNFEADACGASIADDLADTFVDSRRLSQTLATTTPHRSLIQALSSANTYSY